MLLICKEKIVSAYLGILYKLFIYETNRFSFGKFNGWYGLYMYFDFSGDLTPDERVQVLLRFREGAERVLICTNVLARGIDVDSVSMLS